MSTRRLCGPDPLGVRRTLATPGGPVDFFSLEALERRGAGSVSGLPFTLKILLESLLRHGDGVQATAGEVQRLLAGRGATAEQAEIPWRPARVLLQDFTGVPVLVDLYTVRLAAGLGPGDAVELLVEDEQGRSRTITVQARLETQAEVETYRHGGLFAEVLQAQLGGAAAAASPGPCLEVLR